MSTVLVTGLSFRMERHGRDVGLARALTKHIDDLLVVSVDGHVMRGEIGKRERSASWSSGDVSGRRELGMVLSDVAADDPDSIVVLLDMDEHEAKQAEHFCRMVDLPFLRCRDTQPTLALVEAHRTTARGLLTPTAGSANRPGWLWTVGAGVDMTLHPLRRDAPPRPPMRLLVITQRGLEAIDTVLEGLALARGRYIADAHLTVLAQDLDDTDAIRLETKIRELALTHSVELSPFEDPAQVRAAIGGSHALVDTTPRDGDLRLAVAGAMAAGVPVLSACAQVQRLTDGVSIALAFNEGSADELAQRIGALDNAWRDELATVGRALRERVVAEHSAEHWATTVTSVVRFARDHPQLAALDAPAAPSPPAAPTPSPAPAPAAPAAAPPDPMTWTSGTDAPSSNGVERTTPEAAPPESATPEKAAQEPTEPGSDGEPAGEPVATPAAGRRGWRRKRKG